MIDSAFRLDGRVAIVTGASSGIGAGVSVALAEAGATVLLVGRDSARLDSVAAIIDDAKTLSIDLRSEQAPERIVAAALHGSDRIDVLVHCAGLFRPTPFEQITADELREEWEVNVRAPFLLTQATVPRMRAGSSVIFISSMLGTVGDDHCASYCSTKGAVEQLSKALAVELGPRGIRFNTIAPGAIATPMNEAMRGDDDFYRTYVDFPPARRWGTVEDIAPAAVFLASPASAFCHGARLAVDGGWVAR